MQQNIVFINQRGNYFSLEPVFRQIINQVCNKQQSKDNCRKHGFKNLFSVHCFFSIKKRKQIKKRNTQHIRSRGACTRGRQDICPAEGEGSWCRAGQERRSSREGQERAGADYLLHFTAWNGFRNVWECLYSLGDMQYRQPSKQKHNQTLFNINRFQE